MPLLLKVDGLDLVKDVSEDLDVEMVGHHDEYQPVPELYYMCEVVYSLPCTVGLSGGQNVTFSNLVIVVSLESVGVPILKKQLTTTRIEKECQMDVTRL